MGFFFLCLCIYFFNLLFNWRKIALQCLCWFLPYNSANQPYLDIYHLPPESTPHNHSHTPRSSQSTGLGSLCCTATYHQLSILHMVVYIWASQVTQVVKNPTGKAGDAGSIPRSGRSSGGGNGNTLQHSCLENLMDREAWWATVHSLAQSQAQLKQLNMNARCIYVHATFSIHPTLKYFKKWG